MQVAQSGGVIAAQAVDAMARIESATQTISDIIRVIDDIAFQTNLLVLNAAVEAGNSFAVTHQPAQRPHRSVQDRTGRGQKAPPRATLHPTRCRTTAASLRDHEGISRHGPSCRVEEDGNGIAKVERFPTNRSGAVDSTARSP